MIDAPPVCFNRRGLFVGNPFSQIKVAQRKATHHLLKALWMKAEVTFVWENKDKAAHPGKTGRMTYGGA